MKKYKVFVLLMMSFVSYSQIRSITITPDSVNMVGNKLVLKDGTENRTGAYLKNKGGGLVEFNYAVDSVWFNSDTLYVSKETVKKYKLNSAIEYLDGNEIQTVTPTSWATNNGVKIPLLRLRHPYRTHNTNNSVSIDQDFKIIPYQYGIAAEYNGVYEQWVGEFSIHRGVNYYDVEGLGNGWGGVLWVGDDHDGGGLRMTARNNTVDGGNVKYTEISSEGFNSSSAGNLRLRVVDTTNRVDFVLGSRGSNNVYSYINKYGFKLPDVNEINSIPTPVKGLMVFDNSDSTVKYNTGNEWKTFVSKNTILDDTINADVILSYQSSQIKYVNAENRNVVITLPPTSSISTGLIFKIIRIDNSSNIVTISVSSNSTINGVSSKIIQNQYDCMNLYSNKTNHWIATKESAF